MNKYVSRIISGQSMATLKEVDGFKERVTSDQKLDVEKTNIFCNGYSGMPERIFAALLDRGYPSTIAHMVNGFGKFGGGSISYLDAIASVVQTNTTTPYISQNKGQVSDLHPWQIFAYSCMAGVSSEIIVPKTNQSLRNIALNSRRIELGKLGFAEMGHFLFAASFLVPDKDAHFSIDGTRMKLQEIFTKSLEAHLDQQRATQCLDFHLTEGMCVAATRVAGLEKYKEIAQGLINRQLEVLGVIGFGLSDSFFAQTDENGVCASHFLMREYMLAASHCLELAAFAKLHGFEISEENRNLIRFVTNQTAEIFSYHLGTDVFSMLAHHRRALTLWMEIEKAERENRSLDGVDYSAYSVKRDNSEERGIRLVINLY